MELTKAQRALVRSLYTRHGRKKTGLCVVEGVRAAGELFAARPDLVEFAVCTQDRVPAEFAGPTAVVGESAFAELAATVNAQGILAVTRTPEPPSAAEAVAGDFVVALDRVGDPGNFGTICRTARAAGIAELWLTEGSVDPFGDKALRAGLGSQFSMKIRWFEDLEAMRQFGAAHGFPVVWLTDPHQGENCFSAPDLYDHTVLVIGSEGAGVAELPGAPRVTIPMPGGFESLNAAQAATIFIFEYVRRTTGVK